MDKIKRQLSKGLCSKLASETGRDGSEFQKRVDEVVAECVETEYTYPVECVTATPRGGQTKKLQNIEIDLLTALALVSQIPALTSKNPEYIGGSVILLCKAAINQAIVPLDAKTGFVYWIAYENRHEKWEIPKKEIPPLVIKACEDVEDSISFRDSEEIYDELDTLDRLNCIDYESRDGVEYVVLRETCESEWRR